MEVKTRTKTCRTCGTEKELWEFWNTKKYADGKHIHCGSCLAAYNRRFRKRKERYIPPYQVITGDLKPCKTCKKDLPLDRFSESKNCRTRLHSECKACVLKGHRDFLAANPEAKAKEREYSREWAAIKRRKDGVKARQYKDPLAYGHTRRNERLVPINPELVAAVQKFVQRKDEGWGTVALRAGFVHNGRIDTSQVQRRLGLKETVSSYKGKPQYHLATSIKAETGANIARAIYRDPTEFGY